MNRRTTIAALALAGAAALLSVPTLAQTQVPAPSARTPDTAPRTSAILPEEVSQPRGIRATQERVQSPTPSNTTPPMPPTSGRQ